MTAHRRRAAAGEVFFGEVCKKVCKNKNISPSNAICPAYHIQKTGQPSLAARFLMVWVRLSVKHLLLPLLFSVHLPLTARCLLRVAHYVLFHSKHSAKHTKELIFQGHAVRAHLSANLKTPSALKRNSPAQAPGHTVFAIQYAVSGGLCRGRSRRGRLWRDRPLLKRRVPPRSSPTVGTLRGGGLQGLP